MSKRSIMIIGLLLIVVSLCNATELVGNYQSISGSVSFGENDSIALKLHYPNIINSSGKYSLVEKDGLTYLTFQDYNWLCLYSREIILLYNSEGFPFFFGIKGSAKLLNNFGSGVNYEVSSFLKENDQDFSGDNLSNLKTFSPWVESSVDDGLSDWVRITDENSKGNIAGFIFYNGFVSYDKPYLYRKNNRVKSMLVYDSNGDLMSEIFLADTPHPQFVKLEYETDSIKLEINSVYFGNTWSDTCINAIDPVNKFV